MRVLLHGLAGAGVLVALGCHARALSSGGGSGAPAPGVVADSSDTTAAGTVRVVGAAPAATVMLVSDSGSVALAGARSNELATLDGAEVQVSGMARPASPPLGRTHRAITVERYRILQIAGREPVVGILSVSAAGDFRIDTIPLVAPTAQFARLVGSKIWVVGTRQGAGPLLVASYGVLAPPASVPD
ncbi:MAG: hypothetical protein ACREOJ_08150 [Gemmatimonadaceae bacterium]